MTIKKIYNSERAALINAIHRCHNDKHPAYYNYGERGIRVHEDWHGKDGFARFLDHIGPKPSPELTLDRIDNDGDYEPGNVRWATRSEQQSNRRPPASRQHYTVKHCQARNVVIVNAREHGASIDELAIEHDLSKAQIYTIVRKARGQNN